MTIFESLAIMVLAFYVMAKVVDDLFIVSLDNISKWLKLCPNVAGATLMAVGTSAPELATALYALLLPNTNPATGIGTIVGSAIFQILVVIGFASLVKTSYLNWKPVIRDGAFYAVAVLLLIIFIQDGVFTLLEALFLIGTYLFYLVILFCWNRFVDDSFEQDPIEEIEKSVSKNKTNSRLLKLFQHIMWPIDRLLQFFPNPIKNEKWTIPAFVFSLATIAFLSYWLVIAAESFALSVGVPTAIVALTILAGGTSLPELVSSFIVAKQGRGDMAIANAVGSNIFDILISLGLPIFIFTLIKGNLTGLENVNINSSVILLFATLVSMLLLLASQKFKANRMFGVVLIGAYVIYVVAAYGGYV